MYPPVTIIMTTYFLDAARIDAANHALLSWSGIDYKGEVLLHVADDGSQVSGLKLPYRWNSYNASRVSYSRQERRGVGASLNAGLERAFNASPLVAHFVDDWYLDDSNEMYFDINPWIKLLLERDDVGLVRLGVPHPSLTGKVEMFTEDWMGWGLRLDRHDYAFSFRPFVMHKRFIDAYGYFEEGVSALECEYLYNKQFCSLQGPDIVLALPHPWKHLDTQSLSALEPNKGK